MPFFKPDTTKALQFFQLLRYGSLFLIGVLFSKIGLSLKEIGIYEILLMLGGMLSFFWLSGIINTLLAHYEVPNFGNQERKSKVLFSAFMLISIFSIFCFLTLRFWTAPLLHLMDFPADLPYYKLFSWFMLISIPTYLIEYILLLKNKPGALILYGLVSFPIQICVTVIPAYLFKTIEYSIYGLLVISILKFLFLSILLNKYALFEFSTPSLKLFLLAATPLIASTLLSGSAEYIDGLFVTHYFGTKEFAIYQYGARELPIALLLANALSNSMIPFFSKEPLPDTLSRIKSQSNKLMHVLFPVSIVLLMISHQAYPVLFNPAFKASASVFNVFLLLIISRLVFPQTILLGKKKNQVILWISITELILNIGFSFYLLHYFGIMGVAMGTVIAFIIEKLILMTYAFYKLNIKPKEYISLRLLGIYSLILTILYVGTLFFQL
jgi:O-antigen/teichoic acid export membrane protein